MKRRKAKKILKYCQDRKYSKRQLLNAYLCFYGTKLSKFKLPKLKFSNEYILSGDSQMLWAWLWEDFLRDHAQIIKIEAHKNKIDVTYEKEAEVRIVDIDIDIRVG